MPVTGDFDGRHGPTSRSIDRRPAPGTSSSRRAATRATLYTWGISTDIPVTGDFDGDGKTDIAVYRPSTGTWYILKSRPATRPTYAPGHGTDIRSAGDFDGDGKTDIAVYRPSTGAWYILKSSTDFTTYNA